MQEVEPLTAIEMTYSTTFLEDDVPGRDEREPHMAGGMNVITKDMDKEPSLERPWKKGS
jgi:hypothetical protein